MAHTRPVLACVRVRDRAPATTQRDPLQLPLPYRVALRARDVPLEGRRLALLIARCARRDAVGPSTVALEVDPEDPRHFTVVALLLAYCDPTRQAEKLIRSLAHQARCPSGRRGGQIPGQTREGDYRRLTRMVRRRGTARALLIASSRLCVTPPKTPTQIWLATTLVRDLEARAQELGIPRADAFGACLRAVIARRPPDLTTYRASIRGLPEPARAWFSLLTAYANAFGVSSLPKRTIDHAGRAALRAERYARQVGAGAMAALTRSYRRRVTLDRSRVSLRVVICRCLRTTSLRLPLAALSRTIEDCIITETRIGSISSARRGLATTLLRANGQSFKPQTCIGYDWEPQRKIDASWLHHTAAQVRIRQLRLLERNEFLGALRHTPHPNEYILTRLWVLSLGADLAPPPRTNAPLPGTHAQLVQDYAHWRSGALPPATPHRKIDTPDAILQSVCHRYWAGAVLDGPSRRFLAEAVRRTVSWARKLVLGLAAANSYLRADRPDGAVRLLARCCTAHHELCRLGAKDRHVILSDYRALCVRVLHLYDKAVPSEYQAPAAIVRLGRRLPKRRRESRPDRAMDALDAVITAGHAGPGLEIEKRVVRELARLVGGWVLFHYADGRHVTLRPQQEHTLSSWTIRRLVGEETIRARRLRKRPEFWRPDQRRPRSVLSFPIGDGTACIAGRRVFTPKELRAVRTVLRFYEARRGHGHGGLVLPQPVSTKGPPRALAGEGLIGRSRPWRKVLEQVARVAPTKCSVVLHGETGTGKERLARALHSASTRSQGPFVVVNCGAVPDDLLGSELFGHVRGAFTGADRNRVGLITRAHRGTLFLDEVADMSPRLQVALLRVLEEKVITPVGSTRGHTVNVRVISASHRDLEPATRIGRFREDLFHRLSVMTIRLPPLRERGQDQLLLAQHLLRKMSPPRTLHPDALPVLLSYGWPGNVRELDNILQAAALLSDDAHVSPELIERLLAERREAGPPPKNPPGLAPRAQKILELLRNGWRSAPELAETLQVSTRTVNRDLGTLVRRRLVLQQGEARARVYRRRETP